MSDHETNLKAHEWWRGAVIYQIYPRSFFDANNDGIGDLGGISEKLDYISSLNIDAIWISPFFTSPMKDFGYDVSNYREVDPIFGTLMEFKDLLLQAHKRNIKVIIDQVLSHTSDKHAWFVESRQNRVNSKSDWYVWQNPNLDGTPPTNWQSVFGGTSWQWDPRRQQYYLHNFLDSQPDLNYHNSEVQKKILDEMRFWLDLGVDGFRLDTINYYFHDKEFRDNPSIHEQPALEDLPEKIVNPYNCQQHIYDKNQPENIVFTERLRKTLDEYDARILVGEIGDQKAEKMMQDYTGNGNRLHTAYSFLLLTEEFGAAHFARVIQSQEELLDTGWPTWAFSNHDVTRVVSRWGLNQNKFKTEQIPALAKTLLTLLCCLRGSICIYQGEELGLSEAEIDYADIQDPWGKRFWPEFKGRDGCRTPMPWNDKEQYAGFSDKSCWLPIPSEHASFAVNIQEKDTNSVLHFTRRLLAYRKNDETLKLGRIEHIRVEEELLTFDRIFNAKKMTCTFWLGAGEYVSTINGPVRFSTDKETANIRNYKFSGPGALLSR